VNLNIATEKTLQDPLHDYCRFSFYKATLHLFRRIEPPLRILMYLLKITICFSNPVNSSQTFCSSDMATTIPVIILMSGRRKHWRRLSSWHRWFSGLFTINYCRIQFSIKFLITKVTYEYKIDQNQNIPGCRDMPDSDLGRYCQLQCLQFSGLTKIGLRKDFGTGESVSV
jgi:hypothetical protein